MNAESNPKDHHFLSDDTRITLCRCKIIDESGKSETQFQWRDWKNKVAYSPIILDEAVARSYPVDQLIPQ